MIPILIPNENSDSNSDSNGCLIWTEGFISLSVGLGAGWWSDSDPVSR